MHFHQMKKFICILYLICLIVPIVENFTFIVGDNSEVRCVTNEISTGLVWNMPLHKYNAQNLKTKYFPNQGLICKNKECFPKGGIFDYLDNYFSECACSSNQTDFVLDQRWEELRTFRTDKSVSESYSICEEDDEWVVPFSIRAATNAQIGIQDELNSSSVLITLPSAINSGVTSFRFCYNSKVDCFSYHEINETNLENIVSPNVWKHYKLIFRESGVRLTCWNNGNEVTILYVTPSKPFKNKNTFWMHSAGTTLWKIHKYDCFIIRNPLFFRYISSNFYSYSYNISLYVYTESTWKNVNFTDLYGSISGISRFQYPIIWSHITNILSGDVERKILVVENMKFYENCKLSCQILTTGKTIDFQISEKPSNQKFIENQYLEWIIENTNWTDFKICDDHRNCATNKTFNTRCTSDSTSSAANNKVTKYYIVSASVGIMVIIIVIIIMIYRCKKNKRIREEHALINYSGNEQIHSPLTFERKRRPPIPPTSPELSKPIRIEDFDEHVQKGEDKMRCEFNIYYKDIGPDPSYIEIIERRSLMEENATIMLDHFDSNYIESSNTSHIATFCSEKFFLAPNNLDKISQKVFWKVIWQEKVKTIICLDDDLHVMQKFIPLEEMFSISKMKITYKHSGSCRDYDWYNYQIKCMKKSCELNLIHFRGWHEHVPLCGQNLVGCLHKLLKITPDEKGPVYVFCSVNSNRIGALILCDYVLRQAAAEGVVDILNAFCKLNNVIMPNFINNFDYYKLVYVMVNEVLLNSNDDIVCTELAESFQQLKTSSYLKLQIRLIKNSIKNLNQGENYYANIGAGRIGPVNVISVDGFRSLGKYVVTQYPENIQLEQFWTYVSNAGIKFIVSLNQTISVNLFSCPYVHQFSVGEFNDFDLLEIGIKVSRFLTATDLPKLTVIQMKKWPAKEILPNNVDQFLKFVIKSNEFTKNIKPVMVLCCDGISCVGLFVGISQVIAKINYDQKCNVAQAVEVVRRNCTAFLRTEAQISYLYEAAHQYVTRYQNS